MNSQHVNHMMELDQMLDSTYVMPMMPVYEKLSKTRQVSPMAQLIYPEN